MLQKQCILRKILYWSPGKLLEIVNFDEKSRNCHAKNPKSPSTTCQNLSKMRVSSAKIVENRPTCKIIETSSTHLERHFDNAPKRDPKLKNIQIRRRENIPTPRGRVRNVFEWKKNIYFIGKEYTEERFNGREGHFK